MMEMVVVTAVYGGDCGEIRLLIKLTVVALMVVMVNLVTVLTVMMILVFFATSVMVLLL